MKDATPQTTNTLPNSLLSETAEQARRARSDQPGPLLDGVLRPHRQVAPGTNRPEVVQGVRAPLRRRPVVADVEVERGHHVGAPRDVTLGLVDFPGDREPDLLAKGAGENPPRQHGAGHVYVRSRQFVPYI